MTDWGLPDWKDVSSYGDTKHWDWHQWRWEFYRRREDLRAYFDERAEDAYQTKLSVAFQTNDKEPVFTPDQPGFAVPSNDLFGYTAIPNPRISEQPKWLLQSISKTHVAIQYYPGEHYAETGVTWQNPRHVAILFDLDRELGSQIKDATKVLKKQQKLLRGKVLSTRLHPEKWLTYLRALDARESGASWSEISSILIHTAKTVQSARDIWNQAEALRFKF